MTVSKLIEHTCIAHFFKLSSLEPTMKDDHTVLRIVRDSMIKQTVQFPWSFFFFNLNLGPPSLPANTPWLYSVSVLEGKTAKLMCNFTGSPQPSIDWFAEENGDVRREYSLGERRDFLC